MRKIIITGGSGMVGSNFLKTLAKHDFGLVSIYNSNPTNFKFCENIKADITDAKEITKLKRLLPSIIIHCAALTNIKQCESNPELAKKINVIGTKNIVELAKVTNARLFYISTDAVFDGVKGNYSEHHVPKPATIYGKTKFEGEEECLKYENSSIIRTNVFGKNYKKDKTNFVENVLFHLKSKQQYPAFVDVKNSPIYVKTLLNIITKLFEQNKNGIFHISGNENLSRYKFAKILAKVFDYDQKSIKKSSVKTLPKEIKYPKKLNLNNTKIIKLLKIKIPKIEDMVKEFRRDLENEDKS